MSKLGSSDFDLAVVYLLDVDFAALGSCGFGSASNLFSFVTIELVLFDFSVNLSSTTFLSLVCRIGCLEGDVKFTNGSFLTLSVFSISVSSIFLF